jgi:hypothetical protein
LLKGADIDLDKTPQVHARLSDEAGRQPWREIFHDPHWPAAVKALPRRAFRHRRPEVIA